MVKPLMVKPIWALRFSETALKALQKIHPGDARRIVAFLKERIAISPDPRQLGKPLKGPLDTFWRYRVGNYRILVDIEDQEILIEIIKIDHRKDVYR